MLWHSIAFRDAALLVVGLPVSSLAVSAAVHHEATSRACRKLERTITPFIRITVAANPAMRTGVLLFLDVGRHRAGADV